MNPLPQNIHVYVGARYEEVNTRSEPVLERQHRTTSSVHETLRDMEPVPYFSSVPFHQYSGAVPPPLQRSLRPDSWRRME